MNLPNQLITRLRLVIMDAKLQEVMRSHPSISTEEVVSLLSFSNTEREHILHWPRHLTLSLRNRKWNHKMPESGGYFMRRVLARDISVFLAIPTTNWNWSRKPFWFQSQNLSLVLMWIIFSNISVLMVVETKFLIYLLSLYIHVMLADPAIQLRLPLGCMK